jgi:hypothetical protein
LDLEHLSRPSNRDHATCRDNGRFPYTELRDGWTRRAAAITLARAGRRHDALLYARAALRDFDAVGPGAAAQANSARQLITELEQEPPDDYDAAGGDAT